MKFLLFTVVLVSVLYYVNSKTSKWDSKKKSVRCEKALNFVAQLNDGEIGDGSWTAKYNHRFAVMPPNQRKKMQGLNAPIGQTLPTPYPLNISKNTTKKRSKRSIDQCTYYYEFDSRTQWPQCAKIINNIRDQSTCGDCWAVASGSAFTDRYCIERAKLGLYTSPNDPNNMFSEADLMSCTPNTFGCSGGWPLYAWQYMEKNGVVTGSNYTQSTGCKPYPFPPLGTETYKAPKCSTYCTNTYWQNNYRDDKKFGTWSSGIQGSTGSEAVEAIKAEIQANGTVVGTMYIYSDFYHYSEGVYKHTSGEYDGGHAIRLIGWGTQTCSGIEQPFWIGINSWNVEWGMKGTFLIAQGNDECHIESMGISFGTPNIYAN
ncbi:Pept_C1 domain-containing protein [Meloidogyne graminicola]|uniref:Pept_C1 domain-containing protein n=1 Tax=Meloidogyne graminicola TaxID=189291 RepID=A0A8S9ZBX0_9BILA|nr:Pept_C1 domain-containing protein [Meloidogyne graminicola]